PLNWLDRRVAMQEERAVARRCSRSVNTMPRGARTTTRPETVSPAQLPAIVIGELDVAAKAVADVSRKQAARMPARTERSEDTDVPFFARSRVPQGVRRTRLVRLQVASWDVPGAWSSERPSPIGNSCTTPDSRGPP